jgi:hypothetical protein
MVPSTLHRSDKLNVKGATATPVFLLTFRLLLVIGLQLASILIAGSRAAAMPWWPYVMVATEAVTLLTLIVLLRRERIPVASIFIAPFEQGFPAGRAATFLTRRYEGRWVGLLADAGRFLLLLGILGVPALVLNDVISSGIPVLRDAATAGPLPTIAIYALFILLPVAQLVEFPLYYGTAYPRLERRLRAAGHGPAAANGIALLIVVLVLALQVALIPIILSPAYIAWRMVAILPVLVVIGVVIRLVPRFMIGANLVHMAMAVMVVADFTRFA